VGDFKHDILQDVESPLYPSCKICCKTSNSLMA